MWCADVSGHVYTVPAGFWFRYEKKKYGTLFSERFLQRRDLRQFAPEYSPVSNVFILPGRFLQQPKKTDRCHSGYGPLLADLETKTLLLPNSGSRTRNKCELTHQFTFWNGDIHCAPIISCNAKGSYFLSQSRPAEIFHKKKPARQKCCISQTVIPWFLCLDEKNKLLILILSCLCILFLVCVLLFFYFHWDPLGGLGREPKLLW